MGRRERERERVGTTGKGDEHACARVGEGCEGFAHCTTDICDGGIQHAYQRSGYCCADPSHQNSRSNMGAYDAVIEIPRGSRVKYEVDHETGRVFLDRVLYTTFGYPSDYGFFENTLGEDGDPLDVLVIMDHSVYPGVGVKVRPVGVLKMSDEAGGDDKVVAVLAKDPRWEHIQDVSDLGEFQRKEIEHFFEHYKDLEPSKWVKVDEWAGADEAERLVKEAFERAAAEGH
jgi:inorganic pyrophosphatase